MVFVSKNTLIGIFLMLTVAGCSFPVPEETARDMIRVYETPRMLSGEEALAEIRAGTLPAAPPQYNQGLSSNYFWVWVNIENFPNVDNAVYIEINNAHIDTVAAYLVRDSTAVLFGMAGDRIPFPQWPVQVPVPTFEMPVLQPGDKLLFLIDKQQGNNNFPIQLLTRKEFAFLGVKNTFVYAIFFGAIVITFLIALLYGLFNRRKDAIFYSLFVLFTLGFHLTNTGYGYTFIYPNHPQLSTTGRMFFVFFTMATLLFFEYYFLEIYKTKKIRYFHLGVMGLVLGTILCGFAFMEWLFKNGENFVRFYFVQNVLVNTWSLIVAYLLRKQAQGRSYAFLAGHFGNMLAYFLGIIKDTKIIPISSFPVDAYITGTVFELLVFNISMVVSIRQINRDRETLARSLQKTGKQLTEAKNRNKILEYQLQNQLVQGEVPLEAPHPDNSYVHLSYIRAEEHYLTLFSFSAAGSQRTTIREPLTSFLGKLPEGQFVQTHRSYAVNLNHIQKIKSNEVILHDGTKVPLSRTYRNRWIPPNPSP